MIRKMLTATRGTLCVAKDMMNETMDFVIDIVENAEYRADKISSYIDQKILDPLMIVIDPQEENDEGAEYDDDDDDFEIGESKLSADEVVQLLGENDENTKHVLEKHDAEDASYASPGSFTARIVKKGKSINSLAELLIESKALLDELVADKENKDWVDMLDKIYVDEAMIMMGIIQVICVMKRSSSSNQIASARVALGNAGKVIIKREYSN